MGVWSLCQEDPLEEGMTTHLSIRVTWRALVHGAVWTTAKDYNRRCAGFVITTCRFSGLSYLGKTSSLLSVKRRNSPYFSLRNPLYFLIRNLFLLVQIIKIPLHVTITIFSLFYSVFNHIVLIQSTVLQMCATCWDKLKNVPSSSDHLVII